MRTHRRRINRRTAEQLLDGGAVTGRRSVDPDLRRLAAVLAAVAGVAGTTSAGGGVPAAPGAVPRGADRSGHAIPGEAAAVAAFRAARLGSRPGRRRSSVVARVLTTKVAAGAVVALAAGGVAVATGNASLTGPLRERAAGAPSASPSPIRSAHRPGSPSPSLPGLCEAYLAEVGEKRRRETLERPAFAALVTAAGGPEQVASYCAGLLGKDDPGAARGRGGPDDQHNGPPGERRGGPATPNGTGPPTERPG